MNLRKPLLAALLLALALAPAMAQNNSGVGGGGLMSVAPVYMYKALGASLGEQYVTALQLASAFNLSPPAGATVAQICVETAGVRYRDRGSAPTATIGMPVLAGTCFQYAGPLNVVQFILISGSPTMDVFYYANN